MPRGAEYTEQPVSCFRQHPVIGQPGWVYWHAMIDITRTTTALLDGLQDTDNEIVWSQFDKRYRPLLANIARRFGLSDAEAADVAQESLIDFVSAYRAGRYTRDKGRLRSWLIGIQRRRIAALVRDRVKRGNPRGDSIVSEVPEETELNTVWDEEQRQVILADALDELRASSQTAESTIRAFELVGLRNMPVKEAAEELGMTVNDVYVAKSRCVARLRKLVADREAAYEGE